MKGLALLGFAARPGALVLAILLAILASSAAVAANAQHLFDLHVGEALTIPISIVDGKVVTGAPSAVKPGDAQPRDGEITIGLEREKGVLYDQITVTEKTAQPINFLVTGLNGGTKIDETEICGRLDAPIAARIGSVPWRFWLNAFEVGKGAGSCQ